MGGARATLGDGRSRARGRDGTARVAAPVPGGGCAALHRAARRRVGAAARGRTGDRPPAHRRATPRHRVPRPGPGLAADLGRTLAAIHELPVSVIETCGLPSYTADVYRERRLVELDEAAATGRVPTPLLRRWEAALEDVALWRFRPVVVHGDLAADQVLVAGGRVAAVTGWSDARVADPADDLAWLLVAAPPDAVDSIMEAYQLRRTELQDPRLVDRALLVGELALARWLLHGVRQGLPEVVADAEAMLTDLDEATREDAS
ncbi:phosphotransferase [Xylanimonas allomyrinae]|uniref:phosphotransferase n=1 Tax=Xylanimonas allomyrinae TaxID=2509459 RepID=UPI001FE54D63|nr:phosphotransferase [Xylanimonas allomyrinae]